MSQLVVEDSDNINASINPRRNRNRSAKKNPDFVYFDQCAFEIEENIRPRTSSWSSAGGVAVVELTKKKKGRNKVLIEQKEKTSKSEQDVSKLTLTQPKIKDLITKGKSEVQSKYYLRDKKDTTAEKQEEVDEEVQFRSPLSKQCLVNLWIASNEETQQAETTQKVQFDPSDPLTPRRLYRGTTEATSQDYGSDYDSFTGCETLPGSVNGRVNATDCDLTEQDIRGVQSNPNNIPSEPVEGPITNKMTTLTEESLTTLLNKMKEEINQNTNETVKREVEEGMREIKEDIASFKSFKTEVTDDISNIKKDVSALQTELTKLKTDLTSTKTELEMCKVKLRETTGVTVKNDQVINECKTDLEEVNEKLNANKLRIRGIPETKEEVCTSKVKDFFTRILEISTEIKISRAHRIGKGRNRTILVYLKNSRDKGLIFANTKKLKDLKNELNYPYSVSNQFSAKKNADRARMRQIKRMNDKSTGEKLSVEWEKDSLKVEGEIYEKKVRPPSLKDILLASNEQRRKGLNVNPTAGNAVNVEGQTFLGYTSAVKSLSDVNVIYSKLRSLFTEARHITCAFTIPHRVFQNHQDFYDDEEHNGGSFLLQLLTESKIQNRAIFVVRLYDGTHIGSKRYDAMRDAAKSALSKAPKNPITGKFDLIWEKQHTGYQHLPRNYSSIRGGKHNTPLQRTENPEQTSVETNLSPLGDTQWPTLPSQNQASVV